MKRWSMAIGWFLAMMVTGVSGEEGVILQPVMLGNPSGVETTSPVPKQRGVPHAPPEREVSNPATNEVMTENGYISGSESNGMSSQERVVPHAVAPYGKTPEPQGISITGQEDTRIHGQLPLKRRGKKQTLLQRYLRIVNRELGLTKIQKQRIRQILRERREKWKKINRNLVKLKKKYSRIPPARSFMGAKRFNVVEFELAVAARKAQLGSLKKEKQRRYVHWMARTMKMIHQVLTPQQRRTLIRLTNPSAKRPERQRQRRNVVQ